MNSLAAFLAQFIPLLAMAGSVVAVVFLAHRILLGQRPDLSKGHRFSRQLAILGLSIAGTIAVVLTLPASDSTRNQIIGLIGMLLSGIVAFSSTTIIANFMAGLVLRMTRAFRTGDFIRVNEFFGRVAERGMLDTEIQTEQRELVSLSNSYLITNPVTVVRSSGTIISASLSLGYDVHHARVEGLLLAAAQKSGLEDAFVQIIELGDYSITYRASGLLADIKSLITARSNLYRAILDTLHGDGVEIVSPAFMNQRRLADGEKMLPLERAPVPASDKIAPEDIVFDKAEEAEQRENAEHALRKEVRALEEQVQTNKNGTREEIDAQLVQKRQQLTALTTTESEGATQPVAADDTAGNGMATKPSL